MFGKKMKTINSICFSAVLLTSMALIGCAAPKVVEPHAVDPVKSTLEKIMVDADSLPAHSASADARAQPAIYSGDRITIRSYIGEASGLLSRIARARGLKFEVTGPEPRLPLLITVDVEMVSFEDFLRTIGHQFGQRADLVLGDKRIEIRYRGQP